MCDIEQRKEARNAKGFKIGQGISQILLENFLIFDPPKNNILGVLTRIQYDSEECKMRKWKCKPGGLITTLMPVE